MAALSPLALAATCAAFGLCVGSFLNVAIYRFPKQHLTVWRPARSFCPGCERQLGWSENLPVLSWVAQGGRCRGCRGRISIRYPLVELLTAGAWAGLGWMTPAEQWPLLLVRLLVTSALIVVTFVDFDCFEIPDEISIGGMLLAPAISWAVPELHRDTWLAHWVAEGGEPGRTAALVASLGGIAVGALVLLAIGWAGKRALGKEAMGLGDVKLLGAAGGFVGPGGALVALVLASLVGALVGSANIARFYCLLRARARARNGPTSRARSLEVAKACGQMLPFGPYLALGTLAVLLYWNHLVF
ncbi:MAG: hypothetical protein FJ298_12135 [Planctomycetes bacterium]|nr:hypothetical protein [Planctomycetota bacterium]